MTTCVCIFKVKKNALPAKNDLEIIKEYMFRENAINDAGNINNVNTVNSIIDPTIFKVYFYKEYDKINQMPVNTSYPYSYRKDIVINIRKKKVKFGIASDPNGESKSEPINCDLY